MSVVKFIVAAVLAFFVFTAVRAWWPASSALPTAPASPLAALPIEDDFAATGVLTFYKGSAGVSAWLVYEKQDSTVGTKALSFSSASVCLAESGPLSCGGSMALLANLYGGTQVRVIGNVKDECVAVHELSVASEPDARIALVRADLTHSATALGVTIAPLSIEGSLESATARADLAHDGISEEILFEQGTLVSAGARKLTLTHVSGGALFFAIAVNE